MQTVKRVRLSEIVFDAGTQVRAALNQEHVVAIAEAMTAGVLLPPIALFHDGNHHYIGDGFHRFMAAQRLDWREIDANVRAGGKDDALWFALGANREHHALKMTAIDKTHAVGIALKTWPERVQREIAEQVGCSESLVSKVWASVAGNNTSVEPGIRGRALKASMKREAVKQMVSDGATSIAIKEALGAHTSMIAEVRAELGMPSVNRSKAAVAQRRKDIRDMAERGFSTRQIAAHIGVSEETVGNVAKKEGITIHADRVVKGTKRHDSNRIVEQMVIDAENLTADVGLINFGALDGAQIAGWLASLKASRDKLGAFIRRLMQEQKQHGEAA